MNSINKLCIMVMVLMALVSFTNLFGIHAAGISVCLGVIFFFINNAREKQASAADSGLDFKAIGTNLKEKSIWFWMTLPIFMDAISIALSKLFLPEYLEHVLKRTDVFISMDQVVLLLVQLSVLALGEEIAWRGFFQKQLVKALPIAPVLIISSLLFAIGHVASGKFIIVAYDVFFVFINSILYGIIFHKTNNAWLSAISHFIANLFSIIVLVFL